MISAHAVAAVLHRGDQGVMVMGNGGSLAQASHLAAEMISYGVPAFPLTDPAVITALANDFGYDTVFERYMDPFAQFCKYFIGFTTSVSSNIAGATYRASQYGMKTILVTGGPELDLTWLDLHVRFPGDTQKVQESTLEWIHELYAELKELHTWTFTAPRLVRDLHATSSQR